MVLLLFGPPGCGKGTQARQIISILGIPAISTGDLIRAEMAAGTPLGARVQSIVGAGGLVGDELVNAMLMNRLRRPDCRGGFLLDGYPRTLEQAIFLDGYLAGRGLGAPLAIHIDVPAEAIVGRITARRSCPNCRQIYNLISQPPARDGVCDECGQALIIRNDDKEEVVRERLRAYDAVTAPVIEHYRAGNYHVVDGTLSPAAVFREIESALAPELVASH